MDSAFGPRGGVKHHSPGIAQQAAYFLAVDHRSGLVAICADALGCRVEDVGRQRLLEVKQLVVDAVLGSRAVDRAGVGILIDEDLGADQARRAHDAGLPLAMPIEVSGAATFKLEFGDEMLRHLETFDVDYAKALVYLNPDLEDAYRAQISAVAKALRTIAAAELGTMLEVVVIPTVEQLARHDGDGRRFDRETRPALVCQAIRDLHGAGANPRLWNLEGLDRAEDYARVQASVFAHDGDSRCLVLGRGLAVDRVREWLQLAAAHNGFSGFAVGRTIWQDPVARFLAGELDGGAARAEISQTFAEMISEFRDARPSMGRA